MSIKKYCDESNHTKSSSPDRAHLAAAWARLLGVCLQPLSDAFPVKHVAAGRDSCSLNLNFFE